MVLGLCVFWTKKEEDALIAAMRDSSPILNGNSTPVLSSGFFVEVEKKSVSAFPVHDLRASPRIESKEKKEPEAVNIRGKPFPYYDDWLVLFGKDRATGELAESATEAVENINLEEQSWMNLDNDVDPTVILPTPVEFTQGSETKSPGSTSSISKGGKKELCTRWKKC
ncbi:hypothetical protein Dimus_015420 [Dionaea muscipula]